MKQLILALVLLASVSGAQAQTMKADPAYGVMYTEERVTQLPRDEQKPYLSLFGDTNDARYQTVKRWFDANPTLAGLKAQSHFVAIDTASPLWTYRYRATVAQTPTVRLQDSQGNVVAEFAGNGIPMSAEALSKALNTKAGCWPWRKPEPVQPTPVMPQPDPAPQPLEPAPVFVTPEPEPEPTPMWPSIGLIVLAAIVGGALGVRRGWKQSN